MERVQPQQYPSTFAQIVDRLKDKTEEELKLLYLRLFADELKKEWKDVSNEATFGDASEEDIVRAIQKNRYK